MAKLLVAAGCAALAMVLLGYAGGGRLGNFGDVGVDQSTFGFAVFFWFAVVGAVTVVMTGGVRRRPKPPRPPKLPEPAPSPDADFHDGQAVLDHPAEPETQDDADDDVDITASLEQTPSAPSTVEQPHD